MKLLAFPTTIAAALCAVQNWEWALYLVLWIIGTTAVFMIFKAIHHYLFEP